MLKHVEIHNIFRGFRDHLLLYYASFGGVSIYEWLSTKMIGAKLSVSNKKVRQATAVKSDIYEFFVDEIIKEACRLRASDIHLESGKEHYRVRFRIDGKLNEYVGGDMRHFQSMVNRIKYLANMNIAEKRVAQDGAMQWSDPPVEIRISTMPTFYGEKCVLRLLVSQQLANTFDYLGIPDTLKENYQKILRRNSGLILVTGPTGSGKTTTMYTSLQYLNHPQKNIVTIEDPIEYLLEGINQMQIHEQRGITFHTSLRAILRQDPDVIMIGEIRDQETADIAIRASLTGHQILSTLHTHNTVSAIVRLLDMGIAPYLLVQGVSAIIAQRLVRKTCLSCHGAGCDQCYYTGYFGRIGVFEMLVMDDMLADCITQKKSMRDLYRHLQEHQWMSMLDYAHQLKDGGVIDEREYQELYYSLV